MRDEDAPPRATLPCRLWVGVRRPTGLVEQTRWLFCIAALLSTALTLPAPLRTANATTLVLTVAGAGGLTALWLYRYVRRSSALLVDLAEGAAVTSLTLACPEPGMAFAFAFSALWFRALYGSTGRVLLHGVVMMAALAAVLPLWGLVPGHAATTPAATILGPLPIMLMMVAIARHLATSLFAREQSQRRDAALVQLGTHLLGVPDRGTIYARAWESGAAICEATPGLVLLAVADEGDRLRVAAHAGALTDIPQTLPRSVLPTGRSAAGSSVPDTTPLDAAAGGVVQWLGVPLPEHPGTWLLIGAPSAVADEAVTAIRSMTNQVALAVRSSDARSALATQAHTDPLTGLANRAAFTSALDAAMAADRGASGVLFLDLDDFKLVNDGLGHAAGDELLRQIATRLRDAVRADDLCARLGGDEFAVLLSDGPGEATTGVAERLVEAVAAPVCINGHPAQVGASVGLAHPAPGVSAEQLLQQADIAMYAAKAKGKNRVQVYHPGLLETGGEAAFEAELGAAAHRGQLVVHYQPIVAVPDGRCVAVEALVRWEHPTLGLLAPGAFIEAAERTGAILDIGTHVLRQACAEVATWSRAHGDVSVHVNVSAAQLTDPGFVDTVHACVTEYGLAPKQLVLEVTESMVLDPPAIRATLRALVDLGAAVAIDDFSTGYAGLTTLRTLPLDIVKIDRSFVSGGPALPADRAVVEAVVQLARRLGLQTVAEGVEDAEQSRFLAEVGVDAAQGYLHLRPAPAEVVRAWLRDRERITLRRVS